MESKQQINLSLDKTTEIKCEKCGNTTFSDAVLMRKASKFLTGTQQDSYIPIPVFACTKCQHVNIEFLPPQLRSQTQE
jgi:DNA-directed RNA polymerase subunit M/transcription elongation factor TFIIS